MSKRIAPALFVACCLAVSIGDATAQATRISGLIQPQGNVRVTSFQTTPNGLNTVFIADADTDTLDELYVVPAAGGARVKISASVPRGSVVSFKLTPDSAGERGATSLGETARCS